MSMLLGQQRGATVTSGRLLSVASRPNDHRAKQDMGLDQQLQNKW